MGLKDSLIADQLPMTPTPFVSASPAARILALLAVVVDVASIRFGPEIGWQMPGLCALAGLTGVLCLQNGNAQGLGLNTAPVHGWSVWVWRGVLLGLALVVLAALLTAACWVAGWTIPVPRTAPTIWAFLWMCVMAPLTEEITYRWLLSVALLPTLGRAGTIAVSGCLFAVIHILYGNASPENQVAGFLLQWAFLSSRCILVPMALHSAGNGVALLTQVVAYYQNLGQAA